MSLRPTAQPPCWALPAAQIILPASATRDQWLAARRHGVGSSDIAVLLRVNDNRSEYELWLDKTGRLIDEARTEPMRRGTWLEPHVVDFFTERTGVPVRRCGLAVHRAWPELRATPDRLTADGGVVEVKTVGPYAKVGTEWRHGGIARAAYVQGQWQLLVTGRSHVWFAAYTVDQEPQIRGPVDRDDALIEGMVAVARTWWADHVLADAAPPPDLARITDEEIALRWPTAAPGTAVEAQWPAHVRALLEERTELKAAESAVKNRAKEIDQALRVMAGACEALCVGDRPVVTFKSQLNNPSVDPALEGDHPDIYSRYIRRSSSRRIHIVRGWDS